MSLSTQNRIKEAEFWDDKSKKEREWIMNTPTSEIVDRILSGTHRWHSHWWEPLIGKIQGKKILDIGCGDTYFTAYWQLSGNEASGSDFSPETIKNNKLLHEKLGLKQSFYVSSSEKIDSSNDSLDIVHMRWVIHHIPPELQNGSMKEIVRVLKPGGRLIVLETNYGYPFRWIVQTPILRKFNFLRRLAIKKGILDPEEKALTNNGYIDLIRRNGLKIINVDYQFNFFHYPVSVLFRSETIRGFAKNTDKAIRQILPKSFSKDIKIVAEK